MASRASTSSATSEQIEMLMEYLQEHPDLARGFSRGPDARERAKRHWATITQQLNGLGGAVKSCAQWQKVWSDKKHLTKKMASLQRQAACRTGGGPAVGRPLTDTELKVLEIMGEGFGLPQTSVRTPVLLNDENLDPNPQPLEVHVESIVHSWDEDQEITVLATNPDHQYCEPPSGPGVAGSSNQDANANKNIPVRPNPSSQARRLRWRSQRQQSDLRGRLLDSENKKLAELAGIRTEMAGVRAELATLNKTLTALVELQKK